MTYQILKRARPSLALVALFTLLLASCSNPPIDPPDGNEDLTCSRGVTNDDKTACVNSDNCAGDSSKCLEGFACRVDRCVARECGENVGDCERGECNSDGLCVSKSSCTAGDPGKACVRGEICLEQRCKPVEWCHEMAACSGGDVACKLMEDACLEVQPCTSSDQCRSSRYCDQNSGLCQTNYCVINGIEKNCAAEGGGVCNRATGECKNPTTCTKAGECVDDTNLDVKTVCVEDASSTETPREKRCLTYSDVCDETCRDISKCSYSETDFKMTCGTGACTTINDCAKSQYCDGSTCQETSSYSCVNDAFEPNNSDAEATDFAAKATNGRLEGLQLCPTDVDVFVINDVSKYNAIGSAFVVDLVYDDASKGREVGAKMTIELLKGDGSIIDAPITRNTYRQDLGEPAKTYHDETSANILLATKADLAKIVIKVAHDSSSNQFGVGYSLHIRAVNDGIYDMCGASQRLDFENKGGVLVAQRFHESLTSESTNRGSFPDYPACTDATLSIPERAYSFTVDGTEAKKVSVDAIAAGDSNLDLTLVLLHGCEEGKIDVNPLGVEACVENNAANREYYEGFLEPGDYTVVVTASSDTKVGTGDFSLVVEQYDPTCIPASKNECVGDQKVVCDAFHKDLLPGYDCGTDNEACVDYGEGRVGCLSDFGSFCDSPHVFTKDMPLVGLLRDTNDMKGITASTISDFNCGGEIYERMVKGGEVHVMGVVPAGYTATLTATPDISSTRDRGFTIYTKKSCEATQCEAISYDGGYLNETQTLSYKNTSNEEETIYFVVESAEALGGKVVIDAQVVKTDTLTCSPGETRCDNSDPTNVKMVICEDDGTGAYVEVEKPCGTGYACDDTKIRQVCESGGDTCDKPIVAEDGKVMFHSTGDFNDSYGYPNACRSEGNPISSGATGGNDIVYRVDANEGDYILMTATGAAAFQIWELNSCPASVTNFCSKISQSLNSTDLTRKLFVPAKAGPQYFVFEKKSGNYETPAKVKFEIKEGNCDQVLSKPTCNSALTKLTYCDEFNSKKEVTCLNGCQQDPDRCAPDANIQEGESCASPILLTGSSGYATQSFNNIDKGKDGVRLTSGANGECSFEVSSHDSTFVETVGPDTVYAVKLLEGQKLSYRLKTNSISSQWNRAFRVYLLDESCTRTHCMNMRDRNFVNDNGTFYEESPSVDYYHTYVSRATGGAIETVYIVVDTTEVGSTTVQYTLDWKVESATAGESIGPYETICDGNNVKFYNLGGVLKDMTCDGGTVCQNGACKPQVDATTGKVKGDVCDDNDLPTLTAPTALVIESGGANSGLQMTNNATPSCGAANISSDGVDFFFEVEIPAMTTVTVRGMSGGYSKPTVYIAESCAKLKSGTDDACLNAAEGESRYAVAGDHAITTYVNGNNMPKRVVVGLDSARVTTDPNVKEAFYYMVDFVSSPTCDFYGELRCRNAPGPARLITCDITGAKVDVPGGTCPGASPTCSNTWECKLEGDSKRQAIPLARATSTTPVNSNMKVSRNFSSNLTKTYNGGSSLVRGSCLFDAEPIGPEQYYKIDLHPGDYLEATLKPDPSHSGTFQTGYQFYLLASDGKTCISLAQATSHSATLDTEPLKLSFQALKTGVFYLVVDNSNKTVYNTAGSNFLIDYTITSKGPSDCVASASHCKDASNLLICETPGTAPKTVTCQHGCVGRACRVASETQNFDMCTASDTANELPTVLIYDSEATDLVVDHHIDSTSKCGEIAKNDISDIFMKLELGKDKFLSIQDERSNYNFRPAYYVVENASCTSGSFQCVDGVVSPAGAAADPSTTMRESMLGNALYSVPTEVYLGVTTESSVPAGSALVHVSTQEVVCNVNAPKVCDSTSNTISYCTSTTTPASVYTCPATASACNGPSVCTAAATKPGDDAFAPIDIDGLTWTTDTTTQIRKASYTGSTSGYSNSYGKSGSPTCPAFSYGQPGYDVFHKVTVPKGQRLTATITTGGWDDAAVYLIRWDDPHTTPTNNDGPYPLCYSWSEAYGAIEKVAYTHPATEATDGIYLIVVDSSWSWGSVGYTMDVEINPTP